jgi:hypothetical protein
MRLYRHNDIIEAMVKGAGLEDSHVNRMMMEPILNALLEAVVRLEVGKAAGGLNSYEDEWSAYSALTDVRRTDCADFHALILKLEPKP